MYQSGHAQRTTFDDASNYCDRCGRTCNCPNAFTLRLDVAAASASLQRVARNVERAHKALRRFAVGVIGAFPPIKSIPRLDPHWRQNGWHPWGMAPLVHADQGVPSQRWREYQRRP